MRIFDEDTANDVFQEERAYLDWLKKEKNLILSIRSPKRKQQRWNEVFHREKLDDSYLSGSVF